MMQRQRVRMRRDRRTLRLAALAALATLGSCGIANDSVPRDIDPTKLESLNPTP